MKRYVEQLLEDIEVAQNKAFETIVNYAIQNVSAGYDEYLEPRADDGIQLSELLGIEQYVLPQESFFDDEEIKEVTTAIIQLWRAHGLYPIFVPHLPKRLKYKLLRHYWPQMVFPSPGEKVDVELCDYNNCPVCNECPTCTNKEIDNCLNQND